MNRFARIGLTLAFGFVCLLAQSSICPAADPPEGVSSREAKSQAIRSLPFHRLSNQASDEIRDVVEKPSFYRRMPSQQISCDPQMFQFLVRRPEVMVNIWDMMGITKVSTRRVNPYTFLANDGVGTTCRCDLVYGDQNLHIYFGDGTYDGSMAPRKVTGRCVCILRSQSGSDASGHPIVQGTMDVFLKLDNFGADLLTRTIGPFVGKTADHNFVETAKFIAQISRVCERSPAAAQGLATRLDKVDSGVRQEFARLANALSEQHEPSWPATVEPVPQSSLGMKNERAAAPVVTPTPGQREMVEVVSQGTNDIAVADVSRLQQGQSSESTLHAAQPSSRVTEHAANSAESPSPRRDSSYWQQSEWRAAPVVRPTKASIYMRR